MPRIAAFPKGWIKPLVSGELSIYTWIDMATEMQIPGLEMYNNFADLKDPAEWQKIRKYTEAAGMQIPMMCCSPDFTIPDKDLRQKEIDHEIHSIRMSAELGAKFCRVLSGQRRPDITREEGMKYVVDAIEKCLAVAGQEGISLVIENHYKDDFWVEPEFAQMSEVFIELVSRIDSPIFGVQFDPSNAIAAGEEPLDLLEAIKDRVFTVGASDRYLAGGSIADLRNQEGGTAGYVSFFKHGVIGQGLNDYDAIFTILKSVGFDGWVSIEDGVDGMEQMTASAQFLKERIAHHWPRGSI